MPCMYPIFMKDAPSLAITTKKIVQHRWGKNKVDRLGCRTFLISRVVVRKEFFARQSSLLAGREIASLNSAVRNSNILELLLDIKALIRWNSCCFYTHVEYLLFTEGKNAGI
jgi:hypothetical protein